MEIKQKLKKIGGKDAIQKNVTITLEKNEKIVEVGKVAYMSFSAYVNQLIDADLNKAHIDRITH